MNLEVSSPSSAASVAFAIRNLTLKCIEPSATPRSESLPRVGRSARTPFVLSASLCSLNLITSTTRPDSGSAIRVSDLNSLPSSCR
jgi:hypothetical protein